MHELGVVTHVIRTLEEVAQENDVTKIGSVTLTVGEVSGIVTEQIIDCWNWFKKKTPLVCEAELKIEPVPAVTWCTACEQTYETVKYGKTCPHCGSKETYLLQGSEFAIKEIEAE
ncbi:MAG: hydrogenase maturation nickel metallochaperone HypA [Lachnospiraceae bacterium]|nr:hydrogenase maturation nickel metallochaperone HypA [Lachnospiraceae bacterium]